MKLQIYSPENTRISRGSHGKTTINFSKRGQISISRMAAEKLSLKAGDKVAIAQDEDESEDWFILKSKTGFDLRASKTSKSLIFNSADISEKIYKALDIEESVKSINCLIADEPTTHEGGGFLPSLQRQ